MATEFEGLSAIVTGGASGIGRAIAADLVERGARVASLDLTADGVPEGVAPVIVDLRNAAAVTRAVDDAVAQLGRLDILVNNAGVSFVGGVESGSEDEWTRLWDINVLGYVRAIRAALPHLRLSPSASIVNLSSCTALTGVPARALYSATKGAISAMTLSMAVDLITDGVRVNCVAPGTVDTPFMDVLAERSGDPAAARARFEARQPIGRMVAPDEVAQAVAYLASPRSGSVIGSTITVDGGLGRLLP